MVVVAATMVTLMVSKLRTKYTPLLPTYLLPWYFRYHLNGCLCWLVCPIMLKCATLVPGTTCISALYSKCTPSTGMSLETRRSNTP